MTRAVSKILKIRDSGSAEVDAMQFCQQAIQDLDLGARLRVIDWLRSWAKDNDGTKNVLKDPPMSV